MTTARHRMVVIGLLPWAFASCASSSQQDNAADSSGSGGTSSGAEAGPGSFGSVQDAGACSSAQQGCPCSAVGATAACWTGPAADRGVGACRDGTASCEGAGEFAQWGPCMGEVLDCGRDAGSPIEAGSSDAGPPPSSGTCERLAVTLGSLCLLTPAGGVQCENFGDTHPVDVNGLSDVRCISGGEDFVCALTGAGGIKCWGNAAHFNPADIVDAGGVGASPVLVSTPIDVPGLTTGVVDVAAGETHACVLMTTGAVECWGAGGGEYNYGSFSFSPTPAPVGGLGGGSMAVSAIAAGDGFGCALVASGDVLCWGNNFHGELGDGTLTDRASPQRVSLEAKAVAISADQASHACAILSDGSVWCWGTTGAASLPSDFPGGPTVVPDPVAGFANSVRALTTGGEASMSCALLSTGGVQCWGQALYYLGDPINASYPVLPNGPIGQYSTVPVTVLTTGVVELRSSDNKACARMAAGGVKCWGDTNAGPWDAPGF